MEGTVIRGCNWCKCSVGGGGIATLDSLKPPSVCGLRFVGNGSGPRGGIGEVGGV